MLAWIRSPRGSTSTATVVAVILALFWLAPWQKPLPMALRLPFVTPGPTPATPATPPSTSVAPAMPSIVQGGGASAPAAGSPQAVASLAPAASSTATVGASGGKGPTAATAPAASATDAEMVPAFDVVRVEPTGESVIAGRAAPGSDVSLMDGETVIGHVQANATGQFAFVPPALPDGSHYLSLQTQRAGQAPVRSVQGVAIAVAPNAATRPLVALLSPDKPAEVLSDGVSPVASAAGAAAATAKSGAPGAAGTAAAPVSIQSVQAGQNGNFLAAGIAHPGSQCRVYLNGAYLADVTAGQDGKWSVEIKKGMQPGRYTVRADELDPAGRVSHRAEVPFEYPETLAAGKPPAGAKRLLLSRTASGPTTTASIAAPAAAGAVHATGVPALLADAAPPSANTPLPSAAAAIIPDLHTTTVIRGDSLWRISRKMLGHGIQYTEIYASNTTQIRDPALIYPGQIFVVPSKRPNG